jgi:hypothetical protein
MQNSVEKENIVCDIHSPIKYHLSSNNINNNNYNNNNNSNKNADNIQTAIDFIRNPILKLNTPLKAAQSKNYSHNDVNSYQQQQKQKQKTVNIVTPIASPAPSIISGTESFISFTSARNGLEKNLSLV